MTEIIRLDWIFSNVKFYRKKFSNEIWLVDNNSSIKGDCSVSALDIIV